MKKIPLTIENRWDILYRDYPEIYAEFAAVPKDKQMLEVLTSRFDFRNKVVADFGSGSGASAFAFAQVAKKVIGVEIEDAMRELAERESRIRGIHNVIFLKGDAQNIPLKDHSVNIVTGITLALYPLEGYREFAREAIRVTSEGGLIILINITPGWYGGELANIISDDHSFDEELNDIFVNEFGFDFEDFETNQEYGSLDKIIRTYGFIFGKKAIDYLVEHKKTNIKWKFRIQYKMVD